jgi:hypothetical protein
MSIITLILTAGIPSAITAFCFWIIEHRIEQREVSEKERREQNQRELEEKERAREQFQLIIIQSVNASIALGEATAKAVQRIPDAHCNGDMYTALKYASSIKHKQKDFLTEQGIKNIE